MSSAHWGQSLTQLHLCVQDLRAMNAPTVVHHNKRMLKRSQSFCNTCATARASICRPDTKLLQFMTLGRFLTSFFSLQRHSHALIQQQYADQAASVQQSVNRPVTGRPHFRLRSRSWWQLAEVHITPHTLLTAFHDSARVIRPLQAALARHYRLCSTEGRAHDSTSMNAA